MFLYVLLSLALLYESFILPSLLLYYAMRARLPKVKRPEKNKKVAIITPCVPAQESLEIIEDQLKAMAAVRYPHESWILDEGNNKDVRRLAKKYGVKHFTRKGVKKYNQADYPFKSKTKAGNVNAWLNHVKKRRYDYFVQMDIDHHPTSDYLDKVLGYFKDEKVGWVQAPSVYGNLDYWTARGSTEQDMGMQGPLQMGFYGATQTPVIIGSHTSFRTKAIESIGGFQPTRAEDHLNTLALISRGWKGVFIPKAIAYGDGPETLNAYLSQQYAWARSMFQILLSYSLSHLKNMKLAERLQFIFLQSWYPLSTLSFLILYFTPVVSLLWGVNPINAPINVVLYKLLPFLGTFALLMWALKPTMQPTDLKLSWRGILLHTIRWPIIMGALFGVLARQTKPYQITPKGKFLRSIPTLKLYRPFLIFSLIGLVAIVMGTLFHGRQNIIGQAIFAMYNVLIMLGICLLDLNMRFKSVNIKLKAFKRYWLRPTFSVAVVTLVAGITFIYTFAATSPSIALALSRQLSQEQAKDLRKEAVTDLTLEELKTAIKLERNNRFGHNVVPEIGLCSLRTPKHTIPYIRHSFMDWEEDWKLAQEITTALRSNTLPLVTIEPKGESNGEKLLNGISSGKYDKRLSNLIEIAKLSQDNVYFRFAHEMDLPGVYSWSHQKPANYIKAHRHFVSLAKKQGANNIKWVWSPAGTDGSEKYYPGDKYVDVVGTTLLFDEFWSNQYKPSFYELQQSRSWLTSKFKKPIWITELGIGNKDKAYQSLLLKESIREYRDYGYDALIYIDIEDAHEEGVDYRLSNFKIIEKAIQTRNNIKNPIPPKKKVTSPDSHLKVHSLKSTLLKHN